jgi:3-hydroxyisobutyrate dehydrogenase-like beta-hydroxyacid dehydrogenase
MRAGVENGAGAMPVGFVGLGSMGGAIARKLASERIPLLVSDINAAAVNDLMTLGAEAAASPAEIAETCETVFVCLPTPDVVKAVATGPRGLSEGGRMSTYIDLSTTGGRVAREVGAALGAKGVAVLDGPVSGGAAGAAAGTLSVMISGDRATFERVEPLIRLFGCRARYVGTEVGQGQTLKLVNNLLCATTLVATCEAMVFGAKSGLDPAVILDVINGSSGRSFSSETLVAKHILDGGFDFGFRTELMQKDVRLALEEAEAAGTSMITSSAARQIWSYAVANGLVGQDFTHIMEILEQWGGAKAHRSKTV